MTIRLEGHDVAADDRELASLRSRAYGPHADITGDPAALARLQELEAEGRAAHRLGTHPNGREREAGEPEAPGAIAAEAAPDVVDSGTTRPSTADASATSRSDPTARPVRAPRLPSGWARWIAAVLVAIALAVAAGVAIGVTGSPRPDAVLRAGQMDAELAGQARDLYSTVTVYGIEISEMQPFEPFRGMTAWAGTSDAGMRCLFLMDRDDELWSHGCAPVGLDPIADFTKPDGSMSELFGDLSAGSTIRFILHHDTIEVWIAPARYLSAAGVGEASPHRPWS